MSQLAVEAHLWQDTEMIGKLAKLMAYAKAPRQAFTVLHPFRAAKFGAAYWLGKKLFGRKRAS